MRVTEAEFQMMMARKGAAKDYAPKPGTKYRNKPVEVDGIRFDSKREAQRWHELQLEERAGHISNLRRQAKFPLVWNRVLICSYVADFVYLRDGAEVVEDSKGMRTREYTLKKKMMLAAYGIEIKES